MSQETRIVRPFSIDQQLTKVFRNSRFHFANDQCEVGGRIIRRPNEISSAATLEWTLDEDTMDLFKKELVSGLVRTGISEKFALLAILGTSPSHKVWDLLYQVPLNELKDLKRKTHLDPNNKILCGGQHRITVTACVVLNSNIKSANPLIPSRKGTWLARGIFRIEPEMIAQKFHPTPLTEEMRKTLYLPKNTLRFVQIEGELTDNTEPESLLTYWYDEEALTNLALSQNAEISELVQSEMILYLLSEIIFEFAARSDGDIYDYNSMPDSLICRVVDIIAGNAATTEERNAVLTEIYNKPHVIISQIEDTLELKQVVLKSLKIK